MNRSFLLLLAAATLVLAQDQPPGGGWRRAGDTPPAAPQAVPPPAAADPEPVDSSDGFGQPAPQNRPAYGLPPELTVKPGTYLTVRIGQMLSSDRNQPGDTFVASLAQPVVVDGVVLANRNQLLYGRVVEAERARSSRPSRLGLELTSMTLADGSQVPIHSQLAAQQGGRLPTDVQVGTVATTTAVGAAIGAAADWGRGAAVGAGVGAVAGLAGVMLTRNRPTVIYPETAVTFAVSAPIAVSTANAPHAFRYVGPEDYNRPPVRTGLAPRPRMAPAPYPYPGYAPYAYPPYYGGVSVVIGPRWGYGWGRGRYGRWWW
jgi:hypothetical protein